MSLGYLKNYNINDCKMFTFSNNKKNINTTYIYILPSITFQRRKPRSR